MKSAVPDGFRHDPHDPDLFIIRCPTCEHEERSDTRTAKNGRWCFNCGRLMGVTPVSKSHAEAPAEGGQRVMTDGGYLKSTSDDDTDEEGFGPEDPEDLRERASPAYLQRSSLGNEFVADYSVLDSGWVRVTEWDGERAKFPPHEIQAVREVSVERYGERGRNGRSRRLSNEEHIEEAREKGAKEADE